MSSSQSSRGTLDKVIVDDQGLIEGDLTKYFQAVFLNAHNTGYPYHNFRHMMHVTWLSYDACLYYRDQLNPRERRNLLIAALFHDFNHSGAIGDDTENISRAVQALKNHILPEDLEQQDAIISLIQATEYPYADNSAQQELAIQILRDADLSQGLSPTWMQQVIFGLAVEQRREPLDILKEQTDFLHKLRFQTQWAREKWPDEVILEKAEEVDALLDILLRP